MVVRQVKIPVIAAGGIGDARTFLGALALGAEAVQLGTAFCTVKECPLADHYKQALVGADPYDPKWRDAILATSKAADIQNLRDAVESKAVMQAAAKAESTGIPKEAGSPQDWNPYVFPVPGYISIPLHSTLAQHNKPNDSLCCPCGAL
jgi:NAD(P)H-dependent flavin oxidoreductase YrpB (nitropropane dioxygenase family)